MWVKEQKKSILVIHFLAGLMKSNLINLIDYQFSNSSVENYAYSNRLRHLKTNKTIEFLVLILKTIFDLNYEWIKVSDLVHREKRRTQ